MKVSATATVVLALSLLAVTGLVATGCRGGAPSMVRPSDPFDVNTATVAGDTLTVNVSYGGGCREHVFELAIGDAFMESDPVQIQLTLTHDANDDPCLRWVTEDRDFALSPVKVRFRETYDKASGTVQLNLSPAPVADSDPLLYVF